jgi:hypothetical protein
LKALSLSLCSHAQDGLAANCLLNEQEIIRIRHWITVLQQLQYQLHNLCERSFGYNVTLEMLLQLKAVRPDKDVTLLLPSIPEAKSEELLQAIQREEVKAVLDELSDRFAADTSLEDIIQSLCLEYSILDFPLQTSKPGGRHQP